MKLFSVFSLVAIANSENVSITDKEKQKIHHLKKNWPIMLRVFFKEPASSGFARRPVGAVRFANKMEAKIEKYHDIMVAKWHKCGRASMDPDFERTVDRFDHKDPFKGMTQLTNQYKKWIERQIHNGCEKQATSQRYLNRVKLFARLLRYKYCKYVDNSNEDVCSKVTTNPRLE